jgi:hypothetical protein
MLEGSTGWQVELQAAVCERCDWYYLIHSSPLSQPPRCPHCFRAPLTLLPENGLRWPHRAPPELVIPFTATQQTIASRIQEFGKGMWFSPADLTPVNLASRLARVYLPMWLVDAEVQAFWQAEAGFDYQVRSHREQYNDRRDGWHSQEVTETRQRWEPRAGRLTRSYANLSAPALEAHQRILAQLGEYAPERAQPYHPEFLQASFVRLPDRSPRDAWPAAELAVQRAAAEEVRQACGADQIRQFRWTAEYPARNWTLLLLPALMSYYLDDERKPQPVWINGQTGRISGQRRASLKRARGISLVFLGLAGLLFFLSLLLIAAGLVLAPLLVLGGIGIVFAIAVALAAVVPVAMVWQMNRQLRHDD